MRKYAALILVSVFILLSGCVPIPEKTVENEEENRIAAVWISYSELSMKDCEDRSKTAFTKKIETMFENCRTYGINTVFVHVRPFSDSFYKSEIFPTSEYLTGKQGRDADFDALEIMVKTAHDKNLSFHAWLNPFRISFSTDISALSESNPALIYLKKKSPDTVILDNGLYFSPASINAQKLVIDGAREIVRKYNVDGIHIDDYFYPSEDEKTDSFYYNQYVKKGGDLSLDEWRLNVISSFVSGLYTAVKSENTECIVSVSPAGNVYNNYREQYADVKKWCSVRGYADWIIPQVYYGFENRIMPFDRACDKWDRMCTNSSIRIIYGLGAYRLGEDEDEWKAGNGIIRKQIQYAKKRTNYDGIAFFSYSALNEKSNSEEFKEISSLIHS